MTLDARRAFLTEGTALTSRDVETLEHAARRISHRYDGGDGTEDFVRFARDALGTLVRLAPTRIVAREHVGEH
jgi:hypothetical protein